MIKTHFQKKKNMVRNMQVVKKGNFHIIISISKPSPAPLWEFFFMRWDGCKEVSLPSDMKPTNLAINQIPITAYQTLKGLQDHKSLFTHLLGMSVFGWVWVCYQNTLAYTCGTSCLQRCKCSSFSQTEGARKVRGRATQQLLTLADSDTC